MMTMMKKSDGDEDLLLSPLIPDVVLLFHYLMNLFQSVFEEEYIRPPYKTLAESPAKQEATGQTRQSLTRKRTKLRRSSFADRNRELPYSAQFLV